MATVKIRGEGGVVWEMDEPLRRDIQQRLADKRLTVVDDDGHAVEYALPGPAVSAGDEEALPPELVAFEAEPVAPPTGEPKKKPAKKAAAKPTD